MTDAVWQALPVAVFVLDADDRIADVNGAAEGLMNRSAKALGGKDLGAMLSLDGGLEVAAARVRRNRAPLTLHDAEMRVGPAPAIRCEAHLAPHGDGLVLMLSPREIAGRLDRARSSRAAARSAIGMAEMLAHEIKNPLAGITGAAQLLGMGLGDEDRELTDLIVAESRRIVALLEQVEQFGNLRPPQRAAVNVHDVLDRARRSAMVGFAAHMTLREAYDPSLPPVAADPDQLLQIVLNLLKNAAQASGTQGTITLRTRYDGALRVRGAGGGRAAAPVQVEVIDDGPGIPPEIAANLFEPFVSGRENGTGLGLALVAKLVAEHDGLIGVDSVPGRTVFRLSLPRADAHQLHDATP